MESRLIRKKFIDFFLSKNHKHLESSSLVPQNDPTVLFTTAGMQQLVPYLLGKEHPLGSRLFSIQKCVRTGDIDDVGDERHLTFFEMMGNWSLGDYFKEESITMSYEFLTKELGLDPKRLSATVFEGYDAVELDTVSIDIWKKTGLDEKNIIALPKENNWWPVYGAKGPCGPDSEIHYDMQIPYEGPENYPGGENPRYLEIWNNVFMEFECDGDGNFKKLAKQNVDTGMGLERMAMILQGAKTVYETDIFSPLIQHVEKMTGIAYPAFEKDDHELNEHETQITKSVRVIVDHIRSSTFMIAEGVSPSNEGRGYVLRRLIRRAIYNMRSLNEAAAVSTLTSLSKIVIEEMGEFYPELVDRRDVVLQTLDLETEKFLQTLARGEKILEKAIAEAAQSGGVLTGSDAFQLHDTFGFPISLTTEIAKKYNIEVDLEGYATEFEEQQIRSRAGTKDMFTRGRESIQTQLDGLQKTTFQGYEMNVHGLPTMFSRGAKVLKVLPCGEREYALITDKTVFYAEGGGQVGDSGTIFGDDFQFHVVDTQKFDDVWVHFGELDGTSSVGVLELEGKEVTLHVNEERRKRIMASHTGAHLLHKALKKYLGDIVEQAGSYVDEFRTRFDFSSQRALTSEELHLIEIEVNDAINAWYPVEKKEMSLAEAKDCGAIGLFTEKYGETVRVVGIGGEYSVELCGGIHVHNTAEIGIARIIKESSIASGIRRIEMITGRNVYEYLMERDEALDALMSETKSTGFMDVLDRVKGMKQELKSLESVSKAMAAAQSQDIAKELLPEAVEVGGYTWVMKQLGEVSADMLKNIAHNVKAAQSISAGVLVNTEGAFVLFSSTDTLSARKMFSFLKDLGARGGGNDGLVQGVNFPIADLDKVTPEKLIVSE